MDENQARHYRFSYASGSRPLRPRERQPTITLIPGDGVGPELIEAARRAIDATGVSIAWDVQEAGRRVFEREGTPLPGRVVQSVRRTRVALKGPLETAIGAYGSPNVGLRDALGLHTTIRPCRPLAGAPAHDPATDLVVVKMNQEDLYARIGYAADTPEAGALRDLIRAHGRELPGDAALSVRPLSTAAVRRVVREAFEYAVANGRRRVTAVHKAPLIPQTDGLFLEVAGEVGEGYPDVALDEALVDTVCERLVSRPTAFDVLVMPRMYGDIVSGIATALVGGPGVAPGVNLGDGRAVFEATHGSAPKLAGTGRANPTALLLSGAMLLRHLGEHAAASRLHAAIAAVIAEDHVVTYDLQPDGPAASTTEVANAVVDRLEAAGPAGRPSPSRTGPLP